MNYRHFYLNGLSSYLMFYEHQKGFDALYYNNLAFYKGPQPEK